MSGHAIVDIRDTFGSEFIGLVISLILFGITILQTWIYYWKYWERDPKPLKLFIAIILILDTLHTSLCIYSMYWYLILNFGNVESLNYGVWATNIQVDINTLVGYMVQIYYARRVYILSKRIAIPAIIVVLGTVCFALGLVFTIRTTASEQYSQYNTLVLVTSVGMGSTVAADVLIAVSMCWFLYRKRTGFARTDSMLATLMVYSINSGLLTSILATGVLISFATANSSMIPAAFFWPMGKCYANSFLAMLNSRDYIRERWTTDTADNAFGISSIQFDHRGEDNKSNLTRTAVSVIVHHSATTDFPQGKFESTTADISKSIS